MSRDFESDKAFLQRMIDQAASDQRAAEAAIEQRRIAAAEAAKLSEQIERSKLLQRAKVVDAIRSFGLLVADNLYSHNIPKYPIKGLPYGWFLSEEQTNEKIRTEIYYPPPIKVGNEGVAPTQHFKETTVSYSHGIALAPNGHPIEWRAEPNYDRGMPRMIGPAGVDPIITPYDLGNPAEEHPYYIGWRTLLGNLAGALINAYQNRT